ncbi:hypothetical protein [Paenibacillus lacisoli]|uniref:hypothetical protein n=1 Tax=Paenibacillus lacisoli TaxID=3064525 RepID=UPI00272D8B26|nr:hypothetical protein [Paenibacillus sp. JX-17]
MNADLLAAFFIVAVKKLSIPYYTENVQEPKWISITLNAERENHEGLYPSMTDKGPG